MMWLFLSWVGMVGSLCVGAVVIATQDETAALVMLALMLMWIGAGIIVIRQRRQGELK
jgi:hypothetical protein